MTGTMELESSLCDLHMDHHSIPATVGDILVFTKLQRLRLTACGLAGQDHLGSCFLTNPYNGFLDGPVSNSMSHLGSTVQGD